MFSVRGGQREQSTLSLPHSGLSADLSSEEEYRQDTAPAITSAQPDRYSHHLVSLIATVTFILLQEIFCHNFRNVLVQSLQNSRHDLFGDWNSAGCLDMGASWYFSLKLNYFGVLEWKEGPNSYILLCPNCGMLKRPYFHSRTPK